MSNENTRSLLREEYDIWTKIPMSIRDDLSRINTLMQTLETNLRNIPSTKDTPAIFESIHDLITSHDSELRLSDEVYSHVRTCFDMLYVHVGDRELTESSYHGEVDVEE
jgi:hypothetical protein